MTQKINIYDEYKPLRNFIRKLSLGESLYVVYAYLQSHHSQVSVPPDIEVHEEYNNSDRIQRARHVSPWELEMLAREIVLHADEAGNKSHTLKKWKDFSNCINKVKGLHSAICTKAVSDENILMEMHRLSYQQFPHQESNPDTRRITRYYKIHSHGKLAPYIERKYGMTIDEYYAIAFSIFALFHKHFAVKEDVISTTHISQDLLRSMLSQISMGLDNLRQVSQAEQKLDENYLYSMSPLQFYPLIRMYYGEDICYICPSNTGFFHRVTSGVFYEIVGKEGFDESYGDAFEDYVGELLRKYSMQGNYEVIKEAEYSHRGSMRRSSDWHIRTQNDLLFVECKAKRPRRGTRQTLVVEDDLENDIEKIADGIVQLYKNIDLYISGEYCGMDCNKKTQIAPILVLLEDWFVMGEFACKLDEVVRRNLSVALQADVLVDKYPYAVCRIEDFENLVMTLGDIENVSDLLREKYDSKEMMRWDFKSYISKKLEGKLRHTNDPFQSILDQLLRREN